MDEHAIHLEHEQIAALAYALWEANGCVDGTADVDWQRAEEALAGKVED